eukprot:gene8946-8094_t
MVVNPNDLIGNVIGCRALTRRAKPPPSRRHPEAYGEWEEMFVNIMSSMLKAAPPSPPAPHAIALAVTWHPVCAPPGAVIADVGAHIGAHTVPLAQLAGPRGKVHSFEPQRLQFQLLNSNVAINALHNVHTYQWALGNPASSSATVNIPHVDPAKLKAHGHSMFGIEVYHPF